MKKFALIILSAAMLDVYKRQVYGHCCIIAHGIHSPNLFIKSFSVKYHIYIKHQEKKQFVLFVFQLNLSVIHIDAMCSSIQTRCV